ncbi:hypothetical protein INT47_006898 [Mucor saturninus]|uniref:RRM Nup35-type domain-containing protein n=1 Tax=Mucor saturninus TaxID=64648 RepID=A0A8H7RB00_9FUNG|nr:hypothetical protein INT47_006898 [Mucor saturninus]
MSANSLFGSIPVNPLQTSTTTQPVDVIPTRQLDLKSIPPVFFVGPQKKEKTVLFEPQFSSDTGSVVGYGDRRLSGILAQTTEEEEEKEEPIQLPAKRVNVDQVDPNRGIFGDKRRAKPIQKETPVNEVKIDSAVPDVSVLQPSKTIRVFGYPVNLIHNVIQHFGTYGKIEKYYETSGNWMNITYDSSTNALAALKANGIIISNSHMIGVSLEKEEPIVIKDIVPLEETEGVFKTIHGLGTGKIGHSAVDSKNTVESTSGGIMSKLKDALLGW